MKKALSLILAVIFIFFSAAAAFAATENVISFNTAEAFAGDTVKLTLSISGNTGIAGLAVSLDYPTDFFTLTKAEGGNLFSSFSTGKNFLWDESANVTSNGALAFFTFQINDNAKTGEYPFSVIVRSCTDDSYHDVVCAVNAGTVKIKCAHKNTKGILGKKPTCTQDGYSDESICKDCGEVLLAKTVLKATGHTPAAPVDENLTAATCTTFGKVDKVVYCTVCKQEINRETYKLSAFGHAWDSGKVTKEPTAAENGVKTYCCKTCGEQKTEVLPATGKQKEEPAYTPGDVDLDGKVTAADARLTLRGAVGLSDRDIDLADHKSVNFLAADTNSDGKIDAGDARMILRAAVGLEKL